MKVRVSLGMACSVLSLTMVVLAVSAMAAEPQSIGKGRVVSTALQEVPEAVSRVDVRLNRGAGDQELDAAKAATLKAITSQIQVTTVVDNNASPAGYLALTLFSPTDVGSGDDTIHNLTVPTFSYAGMQWDTIGIASNGYVVIGGGSPGDISFINTDFPDSARPNNVLAPFWTDLDPSAGGTVWIETLTDGFDSWTVVEWDAVPNYNSPAETNTAQVWIGWDTDSDPREDISFTYASVSPGRGGSLTVGAENVEGSSGDKVYLNGVGIPPAPSFGGGSAACDTAWPAEPCFEVDVQTSKIPMIFSDKFESGNTSEWSAVVP